MIGRAGHDGTCTAKYNQAMSLLPVGALAPDFEVAAHDGTRVRLSELAGSYVLLWFYPEADTPG